MGLGTAIGAGVGILGGIGGLFAARKSNKTLDKLAGQNPQYAANPIAAERLAFAKSLLNARMPGASQMERNIFTAQANQMGNINANATDSSQALALGASALGQTNQALQGLQLNEAQDYQRRYGNVLGAQEGMINEGDKVYQDKIRNFQDLVSIRGAQAANRSNAWNSISQGGFAAMNFGLSGGFDAMKGGFNKPKTPFAGINQPLNFGQADASINNQFYGS